MHEIETHTNVSLRPLKTVLHHEIVLSVIIPNMFTPLTLLTIQDLGSPVPVPEGSKMMKNEEVKLNYERRLHSCMTL
jgi:hypothetical protein